MNYTIDVNTILKKSFPFLFIALFALGINNLLSLFLPQVFFTQEHTDKKTIEYIKYNFKDNFRITTQKEVSKNIAVVKKEYQLISNISLQMIYQEEQNNGWIVISENSSKKSIILGVGESFKNFVLKNIFEKYVIFSKQGKEYKLNLSKEDTQSLYKENKENTADTTIQKVDNQYYLSRGLLNSYTKDSNKIWKEIAIREVKKDGKIDGFKILGLKRKSVFEKLGLKKNDIIKSVNNIPLKSYADAFSIYKKMNKVQNMKFVLLRDNKEVELEYEIK